MRKSDFERGKRDALEFLQRDTPTGGTRAAGRQCAYEQGYNTGRALLRKAGKANR